MPIDIYRSTLSATKKKNKEIYKRTVVQCGNR